MSCGDGKLMCPAVALRDAVGWLSNKCASVVRARGVYDSLAYGRLLFTAAAPCRSASVNPIEVRCAMRSCGVLPQSMLRAMRTLPHILGKSQNPISSLK